MHIKYLPILFAALLPLWGTPGSAEQSSVYSPVRSDAAREAANAIVSRIPLQVNANDEETKRFFETYVMPNFKRDKLAPIFAANALNTFSDQEIVEIERMTRTQEGILLMTKITAFMVMSARDLEGSIREIVSCVPRDKRPQSVTRGMSATSQAYSFPHRDARLSNSGGRYLSAERRPIASSYSASVESLLPLDRTCRTLRKQSFGSPF